MQALATGVLYADKQACESTGGGGKCTYVAEYTAAQYTSMTNRVCAPVTVCHTDATQTQQETPTSNAACQCNSGFYGAERASFQPCVYYKKMPFFFECFSLCFVPSLSW